MPFLRPTLTQLRTQALQDVQASPLGISGLLRFSAFKVLSWVQAGLAHLHYGYLDWIARQAVPFTCTDEFLEGWAALVGITREAAAAAAGSATFAGTAGALVPSGTALRRGDGAGYVTTSDLTLGSAGAGVAPILAQAPGALGNMDAGTPLALAAPIPGVRGAVTASGPATGGADMEADAALRTRMLYRYREPPQGGAAPDYVEWAEAVPGVTRAWCRPNGAGAGTVVVYAMLDEAEAAHGGFPQGTDGVAAAETRDAPATGDQLTIADAIYPLRPVTALVYVCAPVAWPVNVTIANLAISSAAIQALISQALAQVLLQLGDPEGGALYQSDLEAAIEAVPGVQRFTLAAPVGPLLPPVGSLPVLGTVTYQ